MSNEFAEAPKEIDDPGDKNQHEQIRHLNDARSDVRDVRNRVSEMLVTGKLSRQKAHTAYRQVVTSYILQLAPYLRRKRFGGDTRLWDGPEEADENDTIGTVTITAPIGENGSEKPVYKKSLVGVKDLLTLPSPIQVNYNVDSNDELKGDTKETRTAVGEVDMTTLDGIVIELDEFRIDIGLGLKLPDEVSHESADPF